MSEAPLLACIMLATRSGYAALELARQAPSGASRTRLGRPLLWLVLTGLLCGAAGAAKLNGLASVPAGLGLCALAPLAVRGRLPAIQRAGFALAAAVLLAAAAAIAFVAPNPYLYPDIPARTMQLYNFRIKEMGRQQVTFPQRRIESSAGRAKVLFKRILGDDSAFRWTGGFVFSLTFGGLGLARLVREAWAWVRGGGPAASAVLLLFAIATATPALTTPLDWKRYSLLPIVFTTVFSAVGMALVAQRFATWLAPRRAKQPGRAKGGNRLRPRASS